MIKSLSWIVLSLVFTGIGLAGGWYARRQTSPAGGGHAGEKKEEHDEHGAEARLSPQALRNMGVTFAEAEPRDYSRTLAIPAVVAEPPASEFPLFAPVAGRVLATHVPAGGVVDAGAAAITLLRDALPLPALELTEEVFKPANEQFHEAISETRRAHRNLELLKMELERVEKFSESGTVEGYPILPRKNLIDLRYEILRGEKECLNLQTELRRHGCTDEQIKAIEEGKATPLLGQRFWKQALELNGLWTPEAQALYAALPENIRDLPRSISTIGELTAGGFATMPLAAWFKERPDAGEHFLAIGGLIQRGSSLEEVRYLNDAGALEPVVAVRAPRIEGLADFDLAELLVKPGEHVEAGAKIAVLRNHRETYLQGEAAGGDAAALLAALGEGAAVAATPLVAGTGPDLSGLRILYVRNEVSDRGTVAVVPAANEPLNVRDEGTKGKFRTWKLRPGLRYMLRLPSETFKGVYVVPSDAVAEDGPDRIVFLKEGDGVKPARVVVVYQDHEVAVLDGKNSELFPGDEIAQHGAFALGLALKAGSEEVDPHAGHNH